MFRLPYLAPRVIQLRVFLSTPGDVVEERAVVEAVVQSLNADRTIQDQATLRLVRSENDTPLTADRPPQQVVYERLGRPSDCDLQIVIFRGRFGTPPGQSHLRPDKSHCLSGTEAEFWEGERGFQARGRPDILVYRYEGEPPVGPFASDATEQKQRLDAFFKEYFQRDGVALRGWRSYKTLEEFRASVRGSLEMLVRERLQPRFRWPALLLAWLFGLFMGVAVAGWWLRPTKPAVGPATMPTDAWVTRWQALDPVARFDEPTLGPLLQCAGKRDDWLAISEKRFPKQLQLLVKDHFRANPCVSCFEKVLLSPAFLPARPVQTLRWRHRLCVGVFLIQQTPQGGFRATEFYPEDLEANEVRFSARDGFDPAAPPGRQWLILVINPLDDASVQELERDLDANGLAPFEIEYRNP